MSNSNKNNKIITLDNLVKVYQRGPEEVRAVDGISLEIDKGDYVSIIGHSGSGKSTMLNIIGCLDRPTSGDVYVNGFHTNNASEKELVEMRKRSIGFVFQQFFLFPTLTVLENVELPALFADKKDVTEQAKELLDTVGLSKRLHHLPSQLSGGEMQRVAIARSLINNPPIILADEPTGSLDSANAAKIMGLFDVLHKRGITIIVVTHNMEMATHCVKHVRIADGKIIH